MLSVEFVSSIDRAVGRNYVKKDTASLQSYGIDALRRGHPPELVVIPGNTDEVSSVARLCNLERVPLTPRGAGTGYTGGAVPIYGGVLLSMERMNQILEIDEDNLIAIVEPNVVTGDLQNAVEAVGLFYPPDPASLKQSVIGGNVAECAGGPRAFKYGTTKQYILGLEAVLPSGEIICTGGKTVKNVVGYDLTKLLVGSEGTLAIITKIIIRLIPKPPAQTTLRATFSQVRNAVSAVSELLHRRVVPAAIELIDGDCLESLRRYLGVSSLAPSQTGALLLIEVDGFLKSVTEEVERVQEACRTAGATEILVAKNEHEREELWSLRRQLSVSLKMISGLKCNHDVVVPKGQIPALFELVERIRKEFRLRIPCFGHVGDGNIHVNFMLNPDDSEEIARAHRAELVLFKGVIALEGAISGEHGIGFSKSPYLPIALSREEIELMKRVKRAFDPNGILNPGKVFPD